jgi:hypothetical protein
MISTTGGFNCQTKWDLSKLNETASRLLLATRKKTLSRQSSNEIPIKESQSTREWCLNAAETGKFYERR